MAQQSRFFERLTELQRQGRPFAVATVVSRRAPVSSHMGDRAVIRADGHMEGFVGGACSREIVRRQALDALSAGTARLVHIRPDGYPEQGRMDAGSVVVPMTCASEGAVAVYIEPFTLPPLLIVAGHSPAAGALARLAAAVEWDCRRVVSREEEPDIEEDVAPAIVLDDVPRYLVELAEHGRTVQAAVVASQGQYDELALEAFLAAPPAYLGLMASRKRGDQVRALLLERGADPALVAGIRHPAGLDVGARTPGEVAVSIMAEIVQARAAGTATLPSGGSAQPAVAPSPAVDPVCHMTVEVAGALYTSEHRERRYYFCCLGCKQRFDENPAHYLATGVV